MESTEAKVSTSLTVLVLICNFFFTFLKNCLVKINCNMLLSVLQDEEDYDVMQDPEFLQSVLENLPGVDPNNEAIRNAMGSLASQTGSKPDTKKDEEKKK